MKSIFSQFNMFNNYQNNCQINRNIGYDVLVNQKDISEPPFQSKRANLYEININKKIIDKIKNKEKLNQNEIDIIDNAGDGNCYFKVLSQYFYATENFHIYYRIKLALYRI